MKESNSLAHYGVMGMKWGVRKDGKPQGYGNTGKSLAEKKAVRTEKQKHERLASKIAAVKNARPSGVNKDTQDEMIAKVSNAPRVKNAEETVRKTAQNLKELPGEKSAKAHTESLVKLYDEVKTARKVADVELMREADPAVKKHVSIDQRGKITVSDELRKYLDADPSDFDDPEYICFLAWEYEDDKHWETHEFPHD